jgi:MFS family permease
LFINTRKIKTIYTISVFIALAAFDNIIIGLFPPLFASIAKDFNVYITALGVISAINILVTSVSSIYWGYLAGKYRRKRLIIIGTIIWAISVYLTSISANYAQLLMYQIFTGIGLGCIASIGFSVLTDCIPHKSRGMLLSLWGMSQGFGGIAGALMASQIAPNTNWRVPFEIVAIIGVLLIVLYLFVKEPSLGESDPELRELVKQGIEYNHNIELSHLYTLLSKHSNVLLFLQGFFMNISTGSLIWLPTLYIAKMHALGYNDKISLITAGYIFALFQIGGLTSSLFGYIGDKLQRKSYKGRARLTSFFVFIAAPLYAIMVLIPMNNLVLPDTENPALILTGLIWQIITNPWMTAMFIAAFLASAAQSANTPNWLALITDVNLPEHRGTAFSVSNLANSFGRTVGNAGFGLVLAIISTYATSVEPHNYEIAMILFQLFLIPSAYCYIRMAKSNETDIMDVKSTLRDRAKIV